MTHVKALQAGHSSQGTSEPITPAQIILTVASCMYGGSRQRISQIQVSTRFCHSFILHVITILMRDSTGSLIVCHNYLSVNEHSCLK